MHIKKRQRRLHPSPRPSGLIDSLEPRRLLAAVINGTNSDDTFIITVESNNSISLLFNGVPQSIAAPGDGIAEVNGLGGNDSILLQNTGTLSWEVSGNSGNDSYTIGRGNLAADIRRFVNIQDSGATAGSNTFLINDTSGVGTDYQFDGVLFTYRNVVPVSIQLGNGSPGDQITLNGGNGDNELFVEQLSPNTHVDMGAGNDIVRLGGESNRISTTLPTSCSIDGGLSGQDTLIADDSNVLSSRSSITFDDTGLVGGPALDNFFALTVKTHQLANGEAEMVTFRGNTCVAPFVTVVGAAGPDVVQIGEPGFEAFLPLYAERFFFDLGVGPNNDVQMFDQPTTASRPWLFDDTGLHFNSVTGVLDVASAGILNLTLSSTNGNDVFTIQDMPIWNVTLNGGNGNDRIVMGTTKDLDNVFDQSRLSFNGGAGTDTVDLDDSGDQTGDFDDYLVAETLIVSTDGTSGFTESFVEYFDAENLSLRFNNDPNFADLDLSDFDTVNIFGNGGADEFRVRNTGSSKPNQLVSNLADNTTFLGGTGSDTLTLSDSDATLFSSTPDYTLDVAAFQWRVSTTIRTVAFDSISTLDLTTGDNADSILINRRPAVTELNVVSGIGDDTFSIGGGDLDSNGFFSAGALLSAGAGNDSIIFDDHLDRDGGGETESYTFGNLSIAKGALTLLYSTFENQTLLVADGVTAGQLSITPVVNLNSISGFLNSTTINGGVNRGCIVNVGVNDLNNISGVVNVNRLTSLTVNDSGQTFGATSSFEINNSQVRKTSTAQTINYTNVGQITLNTRNSSTIADVINVRSTPAGTTVIVNANAGNDNVSMGGGNIDANLLGPVTINAGAGFDFAGFSNGSDTSLEALTLNGLSLTDGPRTYSFTGAEELRVTLGTGGTNMTVNSVVTTTYFTGGAGNESFDIGGGDLDTNIPATTGGAASVIIEGLGGDDSIRFNDLNDTGIDSYEFQRPFGADLLIKRAGGIDHVIAWFGINRATLDASNAPAAFLTPSSITVTDVITPLRINGNGGSDDVHVVHAASPVIVNTGLGDADHLRMSANAGTVVIEQSDDVENLTIGGGSTLRVGAGAVLVKTRNEPLTGFLTLTGVLDLAGGAFLSRAGGPITPQVARDKIIVGRNNGAWNGASNGAINSSLAAGSALSDGVGYGLGSEIALTTIGPFTIAAGDTLLRYTLDGDADLNQQVNLDDFTRLAVGFGTATNAWTRGDFNYNGFTNLDDFTALAGSFGQVLPAALPGANQGQATRSPFGSRLILSLDDSLN